MRASLSRDRREGNAVSPRAQTTLGGSHKFRLPLQPLSAGCWSGFFGQWKWRARGPQSHPRPVSASDARIAARKRESDSMYRRCPSANIVSNASDDLPEPESPVNTTILLRGIETVTFFKLCVRAPLTIISSLIPASFSVFVPSRCAPPFAVRG